MSAPVERQPRPTLRDVPRERPPATPDRLTYPQSQTWWPSADGLAWPERAKQIVAWINAKGGEARYADTYYRSHGDQEPRIAVRTATGWDYAAPGDTVVMGDLVDDDDWAAYASTGKRRVFTVEPAVPVETTEDR